MCDQLLGMVQWVLLLPWEMMKQRKKKMVLMKVKQCTLRVWSPLDEGCEYTDANNLVWMATDGMVITHEENFSVDGTSGLLGFTIENMAIAESHSDYTGYGVSCNGALDGSY